jgi:hypothetical protein
MYQSILAYYNEIGKQWTMNPHTQFVLDLRAWITSLHAQGKSIILSLDANELVKPSEDRKFYPVQYHERNMVQGHFHDGSMATLANTCGLIDTHSSHHAIEAPPTYARGKN